MVGSGLIILYSVFFLGLQSGGMVATLGAQATMANRISAASPNITPNMIPWNTFLSVIFL